MRCVVAPGVRRRPAAHQPVRPAPTGPARSTIGSTASRSPTRCARDRGSATRCPRVRPARARGSAPAAARRGRRPSHGPDGAATSGTRVSPAPAAIQPRSTSTARPSSSASGVTTPNPARPSWMRLSTRICAAVAPGAGGDDAPVAPRGPVVDARQRRGRRAPSPRRTLRARASFVSIRARCQLPAATKSAIAAIVTPAHDDARDAGRSSPRC